MISRKLKSFFYIAMALPMQLSALIYRAWWAPASHNKEKIRVHLGPGREGYKKGWINVDANFISARIDVWSDLRKKLPFRSDSVDAFYSHHVIEHLPDSVLLFHFQEMYRCLKPNGIIRVGGPNGDEACRNFIAENHEWFSDFPDKHESIGGRLVNFLLCRGEHLTILTRSYLQELLKNAGFSEIVFRAPSTDTGFQDLMNDAIDKEWETSPESPHTLLVEAVKMGEG